MGLKMPGPIKHAKTGVYYLRQRMPADLRGRQLPNSVSVSVAGTVRTIKLSPIVKISLATKDATIAKERYREADAGLQAFWRALRSGPQPLPHKEIQALAGVLYADLVDKMDDEPGPEGIWEEIIKLNDAKKNAGKLEAWFGPTVDALLSSKGINTDADTRERLIQSTFAAIRLAAETNLKKARGDYSPDTARQRFPIVGKKQSADLLDLFALLDHKAETQSLKQKTTEDYRRDLQKFVALIGHSDARRVTKDDVRTWRDNLIAEGLSTAKINGKCLAALSGVLTHAVREFSLSENVASGIRDGRKDNSERGPKGYTGEQAKAILAATFNGSSKGLSAPHARALFWVPWLCAYTGLRVSEITQLRGRNVRQEKGGTPYILVTPTDGSTKSGRAWITGIHPHLVELGILDMFRAVGDGPAFYVPYPEDVEPQSVEGKPRYQDAGNRVGDWITKELGIPAPGGKPNHAWRHLFTTLSRVHQMDPQARNFMLGSGPIDAREGYGDWPPSVVAREIARLPRFAVKQSDWRPSTETVAPQQQRKKRQKARPKVLRRGRQHAA